ncbi:Hpt domain-containing protein [Terasakiella sp. SH-1]|uniref:Hpt domain-containing protein n=1 Tax=Terasakiella sp. SH-1 TaxID=2560057 RepID=UPI001073BAF0|nr:Hpt domain-containing protein [Terasakiella sp. SH-1]
MNDQPSIEAKLKLLQERFAKRLNDTAEEMESWRDNSHLDRFIEITHKLAGTAGTFGFIELSQQMKALELEGIGVRCHKISEEQATELYQRTLKMLKEAKAK